jgi:SAM-dependent methyltransferase
MIRIDLAILRCPRCQADLVERAPLDEGDRGLLCSNAQCLFHRQEFPKIRGQPVLIDFEASIFSRDELIASSGRSFVPRDDSGKSLRSSFRRLLFGENDCAKRFCSEFIRRLKSGTERPRILVVGGGAIGSGTEQLYDDDALDVIGFDIYASANTQIVADAHRLPFASETFDGVWIQAVLEHVLDPGAVVAEIHRILKQDGIVYADTPFMQQVHEGAYDFTRFTLSGHRWLFRQFDLIDAGVVSGAGSAFVWSARYLIRALSGSNKLATIGAYLFVWARFLDRAARRRFDADAACGVYFFGRKAAKTISPRDMVVFYAQQASQSCRAMS